MVRQSLLAASVAGLAAGLAVTLPASGAAGAAQLLSPPGVRSNSGWLSYSSGPTDPTEALPQLFVETKAPEHPRPRLPLSIFGGLRQLAPAGVVIWASTDSRGRRHGIPPDAWPPRLSHFRVDHLWKGQPQPRIEQRFLWFTSDGWSFDVRVYFGTQHPPAALLAAAQTELNRLTLPRSERR